MVWHGRDISDISRKNSKSAVPKSEVWQQEAGSSLLPASALPPHALPGASNWVDSHSDRAKNTYVVTCYDMVLSLCLFMSQVLVRRYTFLISFLWIVPWLGFKLQNCKFVFLWHSLRALIGIFSSCTQTSHRFLALRMASGGPQTMWSSQASSFGQFWKGVSEIRTRRKTSDEVLRSEVVSRRVMSWHDTCHVVSAQILRSSEELSQSRGQSHSTSLRRRWDVGNDVKTMSHESVRIIFVSYYICQEMADVFWKNDRWMLSVVTALKCQLLSPMSQ